MKIVFRADATLQIGAGHVMRLSAIAEEAICRGFECFFVGEIREIEWLQIYVREIGFSQILPPKSISLVMSTENILIVDSYHISVEDPALERRNWKRVVSIADVETPHYLADLVVYPNFTPIDPSLKVSQVLSGPQVIPFRKSIARSEEIEFPASPRILVFGGGTDQFGLAPRLANELQQKYKYSQANFIFHNSAKIESLDSRFKVFPFGNTLDTLIQNADIVLTSASTSSFEVLARGIPSGIIRIIRNQDQNFHALTQSGLASRIGYRSDTGEWKFFNRELIQLIEDSEYRKRLSRKNSEVFDFEGSSRILHKIVHFN